MIKVGQSLICPSLVKELTAEKPLEDGKLYTVHVFFENGNERHVTGVTQERLNILNDCFDIVEL